MRQPDFFFFFNDTATTEIYTLSLHDALPISLHEDPDIFGEAGVWDGLSETEPSSTVTTSTSHDWFGRSEEHTSELQSRLHLVCRLLLEKKKNKSHSNKHTVYMFVSYQISVRR